MASLRPLIFVALFSANSLYGSVPSALKNERLCGRVAATFEAADLPGCARTLCAKTPDINGRICACLKDEDSGETVLSIVGDDGSVRASQTTEVMPPTFEPSSFRLEVGNYDGDGSARLLLAVMNSWGNGMAVEGWTVMRVGPTEFAKPLEVADYGVMSFTTSPTPSGRCRMLASNWIQGSDPKRGSGTFVAGRWYDLNPKGAEKTSERPVMFHRYLFSLERSRNKSKSKTGSTPVYWYKFPDAILAIGLDPRR